MKTTCNSVVSFAITILSLLGVGCTEQRSVGLDGPIELPKVWDDAGAYQASPFRRTVEDVALFRGEAPSILLSHISRASPVVKWETQTLLIAKAGPGEVSYDAVTIQRYSEWHMESGGHFYGEYFWPADIDGDGVEDLLILGWRWGGDGWFGEEGREPPISEPAGLRVILREATDRGHPLGIASDTNYTIDDLGNAGIKAKHIREGLSGCDDAEWQERLRIVEQQLVESID